MVTGDSSSGLLDLNLLTEVEHGEIVERIVDCEMSNGGELIPIVSLNPLVNGVHLLDLIPRLLK